MQLCFLEEKDNMLHDHPCLPQLFQIRQNCPNIWQKWYFLENSLQKNSSVICVSEGCLPCLYPKLTTSSNYISSINKFGKNLHQSMTQWHRNFCGWISVVPLTRLRRIRLLPTSIIQQTYALLQCESCQPPQCHIIACLPQGHLFPCLQQCKSCICFSLKCKQLYWTRGEEAKAGFRHKILLR